MFKSNDDLSDFIFVGVGYVSDYDKDGKRTIMDATTIRMKLAKK